MNTNKHTPGDIIRAVITGTENEQINAAIMGASMELDWSDTPDNIREQTEAQAAQMFAVAPNLLAALERTAEYLAESHQDEIDKNHYGDGPEGCSYCEAIKEARAAIAAAKGDK